MLQDSRSSNALTGASASASVHDMDSDMNDNDASTAVSPSILEAGPEKQKPEHVYPGSGTQDDPYIVNWLDHDPLNPLYWPLWKKASIIGIAGISTLCVAFTSSAYAAAIPPMKIAFGASSEVLLLGITFYVLGFAIGPLFWAPMSEIFGRRPIILVSYLPFTIFCMMSALSRNTATMLSSRFLAGVTGASILIVPGGQTADLFSAKTRGLAMSLFAIAPFMGPCLGPIVSGFLTESELGWRANFWLMTIFAFLCLCANFCFVPETYHPVLLRKRAHKLTKETGHAYVSFLDHGKVEQTVKVRFKTSIFRPFQLLFREAIVACFAIYMAFIYAMLYMTFASYPIVFGGLRGWSHGLVGLAFLGIFTGNFVGVALNIFDGRRYTRKLKQLAEGQSLPPEERLPTAILGAPCISIGLLVFAFTSQKQVHWIFSILAGMPFGMGQFLVYLASSNYLVDAYTTYAASALAANAVLRALLGAVFPLFTEAMYKRLGIVWASSLPAFISLLGVPIPWIFWKYGPSIRRNSRMVGATSAPEHHKVTNPERIKDDTQLDSIKPTSETGLGAQPSRLVAV